jgi:tRNA1(Val) A37 N6-methylase TrmN6
MSAGHLLGGRVIHAQQDTGHRSGIEPVLLAATIAARPGAHVLECGSGAGAGLLCLAARLPGITGVGIERDPSLVELAGANAAANGFAALRFVAGDVAMAAGLGPFDHAFANPPWHDAAGTVSPDAGRALARRAPAALPGIWVQSMAAALRPRGTISLILPAARLAPWLAACTAAGCGSVTLLPLWPRAGRAAKLVIIRAVRGGRGPMRLLPGLVLHAPAGGYSAAAEAVLRGGEALALDDG